jgi:hypothetical protein
VVKSATAILALICERVERGEGTGLAEAVAEASRRLNGARALPAPSEKPTDTTDVEWSPADPPPPTREERRAALYRQTSEHAERQATPPRPPPSGLRPISDVIREQEKHARECEAHPPGWDRT